MLKFSVADISVVLWSSTVPPCLEVIPKIIQEEVLILSPRANLADSEPGHKVYYLGRTNLGAVHGEDQDSRATIIHVSTLSFSFPEPLTLGRNTAQIY